MTKYICIKIKSQSLNLFKICLNHRIIQIIYDLNSQKTNRSKWFLHIENTLLKLS